LTQDPDNPFDVLAVGRIGVDLYPERDGLGLPLARIARFARTLGGSPTNVAVAAARYGLRTALVTRVGADPFGGYARQALREFGVDDRYVGTDPDWLTPVVFAEVLGPDDHELLFYRTPSAPDWQIRPEDLDLAAIGTARLLWLSGTGLCREPSLSAHLKAIDVRAAAVGRTGLTVFDLDYRPGFWPSALSARAAYAQVLPKVSVAVGNLEEVEVAVGYRDPDEAAFALLETGVRLAVVKLGPDGVLARDRRTRIAVPAASLPAVNALGAGDAFGGALCLGLLNEWPLERTMRFAAAAGAIVASRIACADAMPSYQETEKLMVAERGGEREFG
jgi:5-dehydro-2-deoxygluconokinase